MGAESGPITVIPRRIGCPAGRSATRSCRLILALGSPGARGHPSRTARLPDRRHLRVHLRRHDVFHRPRVVLAADRRILAALSTGLPGQTFQVAYPPVVSGTATVNVTGRLDPAVTSLGDRRAHCPRLHPRPDDRRDRASATGSTGRSHRPAPGSPRAMNPDHTTGSAVLCAMKQANPAIQVCSTRHAAGFITRWAHPPYDCLQDHPYVGSGNISPSLPIDPTSPR